MDKYIAAAKAFWDVFADGFKNFLGSLSGKDGALFNYISDFIAESLESASK